MKTHEVIVVGAGPAGSVAAACLARRGHDVLLVDRCDFPRDKPCGGGVPPGTIEVLNTLGMDERIRGAGFYQIDGIRLGSPRGRIWETRFQPKREGAAFYVAPRLRFDALIREHAIESGAECTRGAVTGLVTNGGGVVGVRLKDPAGEHEIGARVVIGADGATSAVARALGRERPPAKSRGVAIRAFAEGIDVVPRTVEFYFDRRYIPGYAWIFPMGEGRANVGVVVRADRYGKDGAAISGLLDAFLRAPVLGGRARSAAVDDARAWQLPFASGAWRPRAYDGALLVGDAGGFVDTLTGEGIHNAVVSAVIAAGVVHEALSSRAAGPRALAAYDERCRETLGAVIDRSNRYHRWFASRPAVLEALFVLANAGRPVVRSWLNRASTDFVIRA